MNEIKIFATGRNADFILYSNDEGLTWTDLPNIPSLTGQNAYVSSSRYGGGKFFFVGTHATTLVNEIWYSTDFGVTFIQSTINDSFSNNLYATANVQTLDALTVFVSCIEGLHTSQDGGLTFDRTIVYDDIPELTGIDLIRAKIYFQDISNGLLAVTAIDNTSYFFKTSDGGLSWIELTDISPSVPDADYTVGDCFYKNENNIIFTTDRYILRSTNNGVSFVSQSFPGSPNDSGFGTQIGITPSGILYTGTGSGVLYKNTDGGTTGFVLVLGASGLPNQQFIGITFYSETDGFIASGNGIIYKTSDAGLNWSGSYTAGAHTAKSIVAVSFNCGCPEGFIPDEDPAYCVQEDNLKALYADYLPCPFKLTRCFTGEIQYTTEADSPGISEFVDQIVKPFIGKNCVLVEEHDTFESGYVQLSGLSEYSSCLTCNPLYYIYTCEDLINPVFCTSTDLSGSLGKYVKINVDDVEFAGCYRIGLVTEVTSLCDADPDITVLEEFNSCAECDPQVYKLTSCSSSSVELYTILDLSNYLDKSISLAEYPGLCWTITLSDANPEDITLVTLSEAYSDCDCCFQYQCN